MLQSRSATSMPSPVATCGLSHPTQLRGAVETVHGNRPHTRTKPWNPGGNREESFIVVLHLLGDRAPRRAYQDRLVDDRLPELDQSKRTVCMRRKVLVVDDDPYLTTQLRKLLETDDLTRGYRIERAGGVDRSGRGRLQRADHRSAHAGHGGDGADPRGLAAPSAGDHHRHDGLRVDRSRGRGDEAGRLRLPDQADRSHQPEDGHRSGARRSGAAGRSVRATTATEGDV